jgi:drug/metabolite transporter (DMT)-like permease
MRFARKRMADARIKTEATRFQLVVAFAAVYLIWGSTYLAIRFAIETIPTFLMAGVRFTIAGVILCLWAKTKGAPNPGVRHWISATIVGGLLFLIANGGVVWSEQRVPSGLTALLIATVPLWMAVLEWIRFGGFRQSGRLILGLVLGLAGIVILVSPTEIAGSAGVDLVGASVLVLASLSWAAGSLYARYADLPRSPVMATGMKMLTGGILLTALSGLLGQWSDFSLSTVSWQSATGFFYLIFFGSIIGFSAYIWLLRASTPAKTATYAYVNPIIAVLLGWMLADEPLNARVFLAAGVIVAAVVLITTFRGQVKRQPTSELSPAGGKTELRPCPETRSKPCDA